MTITKAHKKGGVTAAKPASVNLKLESPATRAPDFSAPGDQPITRPWGPTKETLATLDLGDAHHNVQFSDAHNPATRVMLRQLHEVLGSKRDFTNWAKQRLEDCKLVEGKGFGIFANSGENSGRGRPRTGYWVTVEAAKEIAQLEKTERGNAVRLILIRYQDRFRNAAPPAPVIPATIDLRDPASLRQLVHATSAMLLEVTETNTQLTLANTALVEDVENAKAKTENAKAKTYNAKVAKAVAVWEIANIAFLHAIEAKSVPLTAWLNYQIHYTGHKFIVACKMLRALGYMRREFVKGCRNTRESVPTDELITNLCLIISSTAFAKGITVLVPVLDAQGEAVTNPDGSIQYEEKVVDVMDSESRLVTGESRQVLITPDGTVWLMGLLLTLPEFLLRYLVWHRKGSKLRSRLNHRYSFMHCDINAWGELTDQEYKQGVRLKECEDGSWLVECLVTRGDKLRSMHIAQGKGVTLEDAYHNLADRYYDPCVTPEFGSTDTYLNRWLVRP